MSDRSISSNEDRKGTVNYEATSDNGSDQSVANDWKDLLTDDLPSAEELRQRSGLKYRIGKMIWDSVDKGPKERNFLFKLDLFFLSSIMFGYFIKTLNQNNINTAYINGMKEYLHLHGSQLNYLQTMWTVGYILGQIPSNLILHRVSARYYLGCLELLWTALTLLTLTCNSFSSMCAIRFFIGLTESGFFPGVEYLLGSWYSSDELTKRATLFALSGVAASMVTGYLQAAIIKGLQHNSLVPYKWLFVFDGIISFPVALYTMIANPNTPETTTSWYFTEQDKQIALLRRKKFGARPKKEYSLKSFKKLFSTWHVFVFPLIFLAYNNSCNVNNQPAFQTWLKSKGYSSIDYNVYPTAVNGAGIGFALILAWISDWFGGINFPFVILFFVCEILGCSFLASWDIPEGLHWFSYFLTGVPTAWGQPMIFSWVNQLLRDDNEVRNLVVVLTNNLAYVTNAFVPIFTWSATDMPKYHIGFTYTASLSSFGLILTLIATYLTYRDKSRKQKLPVREPVNFLAST